MRKAIERIKRLELKREELIEKSIEKAKAEHYEADTDYILLAMDGFTTRWNVYKHSLIH